MTNATNKTITARGETEDAKTGSEPTASVARTKRQQGKTETKGQSTIPASTDTTLIERATGSPNAAPSPKPPRQTKAALLRARLAEPGGVSLAALIAATGWQAHTLRVALSGLRKEGLTLTRRREGEDTIYAIEPGIAAVMAIAGDSPKPKAESASVAAYPTAQAASATRDAQTDVHDSSCGSFAAESDA